MSSNQSAEPSPLAFERVGDGENVKAEHNEVDGVGHSWRRALLRGAHETLLPADNLRKGSWVLSTLHSFL
jgi:hypothetical protein